MVNTNERQETSSGLFVKRKLVKHSLKLRLDVTFRL